MKRVAKFIRTSTELQHTSIENQEEILDSWIRTNNFILYNTYKDEGISGTKKKKRVQWVKMLEDAENNKFDILVCKSYSRFGRNQIETLSAIRVLRENNIRVVFIEDNLDSDKDSSRFGLMAWLAEEESKRTSTRIKGVQKHFKEIGKIFCCVPPYGYTYSMSEKNFIINDIEAHIVKKIFKLYLKGNGTNKIANILNSESVGTRKGKKWYGNTIKNIITNEAYIGTLVQGKTTSIEVTISKRNLVDSNEWIKHMDSHEAIIDQETFIKAKEIFKINSSKVKQIRYSQKGIERSSNLSLFSNLIKCNCNSAMSIRRKANRKPFYNCCEYERIGLKCGHSSNFIQEEFLIFYVKEELNELIENNFNNLNIINKNNIEEDLKDELKLIDKQINEQIQLANSLLVLFNSKVMTIQQYQLQNESISNTLNVLIKNKEVVEEKIAGLIKVNTNDFKKSVGDIVSLPIEKWNNKMLKEVIDKIIVNINGTISVTWSIEK